MPIDRSCCICVTVGWGHVNAAPCGASNVPRAELGRVFYRGTFAAEVDVNVFGG